ncbi:hypothetical protein [Virgisporangium aurantiacum]|uniref:Uncharacterized protein n=1 Tax=Virgisporangium aurantiacum TaxID=175570 RepID=A0A8J3Z6Z2_9ACTN|nr:hypothetical protein [Virgisporangium aurantiacum]GIJ57498.1 hypothetical protein Vau01_050140 [Virgisporangium aurantiacum]
MTVPPDPDRGTAVEATLWSVVGRLRARGWHISLWEIQRAQDVVAYLFATLGRPPSDDELRRYLRPVFCARDGELEVFAEVFRDSAPAAAPGSDDDSRPAVPPWRHSLPILLLSAFFVIAFAVVLLRLNLGTGSSGGESGSGGPASDEDPGWPVWMWSGLVAFLAAGAATMLLAFRKRLRRRSTSPAPGPDVKLGWETTHPLDPADSARLARTLRTRIREPGRSTLDVPRTVDASLRAGVRLTPRFVEYKRAPEYLAVIEQHSAGDVLAGHYARVVDQLAAQGVAMSRVGLQARSQLVIDRARGPRHLDTLHPTSERERVLLFARDASLRDPLTGAERPWLARFDRWAETIQVDPDARYARPLRPVHRVLDDVRALDPAWARERVRSEPAGLALPTVFEEDDQVWIEAVPPPRDALVRAMDLLGTALGPGGWYWLATCAVYPEISYELTVALGRLVHADDGRPLADHLPIEVLARLPWFRHAYMPDWLRAGLIVTLSRGQLGAVRSAVHQILTDGLLPTAGAGAGLSVTESGPGAGRGEAPTDRVHLTDPTLRRRQLAAAAPRALVAAIRRQRHRLAMTGLPADAPAPRVRRALVVSNAIVVAATLMSTVGVAVMVGQTFGSPDPDALYERWRARDFWPAVAFFPMLTSFVAGMFSCVVSAAAGRRRGFVLGAGLSLPLIVATSLLNDDNLLPPNLQAAVLVVEPVLAWAWILPTLSWKFTSTTTPWTRFQRRNRVIFAVGSGVASLTPIGAGLFYQESWLHWGLTSLTLAGLGVGLGTAYVGGVRVIPLALGATVLLGDRFGFLASDPYSILLLYAAAVAVLVGFALQMGRFRDRPPPEFWETRWGDWQRPLTATAPGIVGALVFVLSGEDPLATASGVGIAVVFALLSLMTDRVGAFVARHRLDTRSPLHLD